MPTTAGGPSSPSTPHPPRPTAAAFEVLPERVCWELLDAARFGRLVLSVADSTDVWPVDFAVVGRTLVIRTAEGTKLLEAVIARRGVLEADHRDETTGRAWSVVVKGDVDVVADEAGHEAAEALHIRSWAGGWRHRYLRLSVREISGRRLQRATTRNDDE